MTRLFLICIFCCFNLISFSQQKEYSKTLLLMGSRFDISIISKDPVKAHQGIQAAIDSIQRIENYISSWKSTSKTHEINQNAGVKPVIVKPYLFDLIYRSKKVSELTNGIFDISYAVLDTLWKFDKTQTQPPTFTDIQKILPYVNHKNILLDREMSTVFLAKKGMKIGFGGIGKGYVANQIKVFLQSIGFQNGLINAGGDLITWGKQADYKKWKVGIADPKKKKNSIAWLDASNLAVVTSGNYEKFFTFEGKLYTHILNPKTGRPAKGLKSVTIVCPNAELADALATSVFILGEKEGLGLINQLRGIECLVVTDEDQIKSSTNLMLNFY